MSSPGNDNQAVIEAFRASGGNAAGLDPLLLLTTTSARSSRPRTKPVAYSIDGDHLSSSPRTAAHSLTPTGITTC